MVESRQRFGALVGRLRVRGHRLTPQRGTNPRAREGGSSADQLGHYHKTLVVLKQMREILEINLGNAGCRYDGATQAHTRTWSA